MVNKITENELHEDIVNDIDEAVEHMSKSASKAEFGHVKIGNGINVTDGVISVEEMIAANVKTENGSNVQNEIDDLKSSVSDGKVIVKNTIIGMGGTVLDNDGDGIPTFNELTTGVNSIPKGAIVKAIHQGIVRMGSEFITATIPTVNTSKSIVLVDTETTSTTTPMRNMYIRAFFSSSTQLRFEGFSSSDVRIHYTVIEFEDGVSVQRGRKSWEGYIGAATSSNSVSIAPVSDISNCLVVTAVSYGNQTNYTNNYYSFVKGSISNSNTLSLQRSYSANTENNFIIEWQVLEFI